MRRVCSFCICYMMMMMMVMVGSGIGGRLPIGVEFLYL